VRKIITRSSRVMVTATLLAGESECNASLQQTHITKFLSYLMDSIKFTANSVAKCQI
jgi:hypothetical protein